VRVRSWGRTDKPTLPTLPRGSADPGQAKKAARRAFVPEDNAFAELPVFDGHRLESGNVIAGPALIERRDTTILVSSSFTAEVDQYGSCLLTRREI
jgi:N-methylhydantoinase A